MFSLQQLSKQILCQEGRLKLPRVTSLVEARCWRCTVRLEDTLGRISGQEAVSSLKIRHLVIQDALVS
jgi:hypothetical protein